MGLEQQKDQLKEMDWKSLGGTESSEPSVGTAVKKRLPKKIRQVPEYYFLPRRSLPLPYSIAFYGSCIAAGVGAGVRLEGWINRKIKVSAFVIRFPLFFLLLVRLRMIHIDYMDIISTRKMFWSAKGKKGNINGIFLNSENSSRSPPL